MSLTTWIQIDDRWRKTVVWAKTPAALTSLIERLDQTLPTGWKRNRQAEERYQFRGGESAAAICYARPVDHAEVWLWLNQPSPVRLVGGNVIPANALGDYRRHAAETILQFREQVLEPTVAATQAHIEENRIGPLSQVSPAVMEALWQFADVAPRVFPLDDNSRSKWRNFVIAARTANATVDPDEFATWFETKEWSRTDARLLANKFFEDAWLLSEYDEARKPA
jgi:hypothetical protein